MKFDDAWLGLGELDKLIIASNPMIRRNKTDIEHPDRHLVKLLKDPVYFGSTCKLLFDIELHPIQIAILQEFWTRPFPMFVASRGFGKSFLLALYAFLKCIFVPGTKIVIVDRVKLFLNIWKLSGAIALLFVVFLVEMMMVHDETLIDAL
jgi:hypothetical protein